MAEPDYASILSHSQLFHDIPADALRALISRGKIVKISAGQALIEENVPVPGVFTVLEGFVKIVKGGQDQVAQLGRGNFFGEISMFGWGSAATASVIAPQGCKALMVTGAELKAWFKEFPDTERKFLYHLARELCSRLYATTERLKG